MGTGICLFVLLSLHSSCLADIYMHSPRGSNNRLFENSRPRNNANRLFDSQNNDRGGYNAGNIYYFADSELAIEWTNQHSCADQNGHCDIIIQYMCSDLLRDGLSQTTIPQKATDCKNNDCNTDLEYGMHEDFYSYANCKLRTRNKGLFTANQNLKGESAIYTRQNSQGTKRGYECPEERDYYPYWHPTQWKDIAILTNNVKRCEHYQAESQNVKSRWYCDVPYQYLYKNANEKVEDYIPIEKEKCEAFDAEGANGKTERGVWKEVKSHGLAPPSCGNSIPSRDNHLGNTAGGYPATFNWTVFNDPHQSCAMRIRYNISTADFDGWNTTSALNNRQNRRDAKLGPDLWSAMGLTEEQAKEREYYLKNNPQVDVFNLNGKKKNFKLQLAVNTAQYGRTFQDRSHRLSIRTRPANLKDEKIFNLNVRGKRGNIVQVYPAVEYDFVPQVLRTSPEEYVHIQWTGSNDNPNGNDGQGQAGTDRSNVVPLGPKVYPDGDPSKAESYTYGHWGRAYPGHILSSEFLGFSNETKAKLASLYNVQFGGDMEELDDAGTYYDIGPQKITMTGDFNFMCTRNNNFSNRSQKGKIVSKKSKITNSYIGELGGAVTISGAEDPNQTGVEIPPSALSSPQVIVLEVLDEDEVSLKTTPPNEDYISHFVQLSRSADMSGDKLMTFTIALKSGVAVGTLYEPVVWRTKDGTTWMQLSVDSSSSSAVQFKTDSGGHFVVTKTVAAGPMAGLVIGILVAVILIVVVVLYCRSNKLCLTGYSSKV